MLRYRFVALVALAVLLVGAIALELLGPTGGEQVQISAIPARHASAAALAHPALASAQPEAMLDQWSSTILERPLFSPSRRPNAAAVAAATAPPRLAGIILGPSGDHAIFAGSGDARAVLAGVGAQVGPYLIRTINATGVDVTGPKGDEHLLPHYDSNGASTQPEASGGLQTQAPPGGSILDMLRARLRPNSGVPPVGAPPQLGAMPQLGVMPQSGAVPGPFRPQVAPPAGTNHPANR